MYRENSGSTATPLCVLCSFIVLIPGIRSVPWRLPCCRPPIRRMSTLWSFRHTLLCLTVILFASSAFAQPALTPPFTTVWPQDGYSEIPVNVPAGISEVLFTITNYTSFTSGGLDDSSYPYNFLISSASFILIGSQSAVIDTETQRLDPPIINHGSGTPRNQFDILVTGPSTLWIYIFPAFNDDTYYSYTLEASFPQAPPPHQLSR